MKNLILIFSIILFVSCSEKNPKTDDIINGLYLMESTQTNMKISGYWVFSNDEISKFEEVESLNHTKISNNLFIDNSYKKTLDPVEMKKIKKILSGENRLLEDTKTKYSLKPSGFFKYYIKYDSIYLCNCEWKDCLDKNNFESIYKIESIKNTNTSKTILLRNKFDKSMTIKLKKTKTEGLDVKEYDDVSRRSK